MEHINDKRQLDGWKITRSSPVSRNQIKCMVKHHSGNEKSVTMHPILHKTLEREHFAESWEIQEKSMDELLAKHADKLLSTDSKERQDSVEHHKSYMETLKAHIDRHFGQGGSFYKPKKEEKPKPTYDGPERRGNGR